MIRPGILLMSAFANCLEARLVFLFLHTHDDILKSVREVIVVLESDPFIFIVRLILHEELADELDEPAIIQSGTNAFLVETTLPLAQDHKHLL